jgi:hypothetical protein
MAHCKKCKNYKKYDDLKIAGTINICEFCYNASNNPCINCTKIISITQSLIIRKTKEIGCPICKSININRKNFLIQEDDNMPEISFTLIYFCENQHYFMVEIEAYPTSLEFTIRR